MTCAPAYGLGTSKKKKKKKKKKNPTQIMTCAPAYGLGTSKKKWCQDVIIADIIWITQITCKGVHNALLIYNWRLDFSGLEVFFQFSADKYGL